MRNVPAPKDTEIARFESIAAAKRTQLSKRRMGLIKTTITLAYNRYTKTKPHLQKLNPIGLKNTQKNELLTSYNTHRVNLTEYVSIGLSHADKISCPYCSVGGLDSLDHILPKEHFPEYSIYSLNLIRCCTKCNTLKTDIFSSPKGRPFINGYFDDLGQQIFLFCKLSFQPKKRPVSFFIRRPSAMDASMFRVIKNHFKNLKLSQRYIGQATAEIERVVTLVTEYTASAASDFDVHNELMKDAHNQKINIPRNSWKFAFYTSIEGVKINDLSAIRAMKP